MTSNKIVCLNCRSDKLKEFREKLTTEYRKLNKDNTISKKYTEGYSDYNNAWGILCEDCNTLFDYETDDNCRVIALINKDEILR